MINISAYLDGAIILSMKSHCFVLKLIYTLSRVFSNCFNKRCTEPFTSNVVLKQLVLFIEICFLHQLRLQANKFIFITTNHIFF